MNKTEATRELQSSAERLAAIDEERAREQQQRDQNIRKAHKAGVTIAELSRATNLTRTMLYKILETK